MNKADVRINDEVVIQARPGAIPNQYIGIKGKVCFIDPVVAISLSITVRLNGSIPILAAPEQLELINHG